VRVDSHALEKQGVAGERLHGGILSGRAPGTPPTTAAADSLPVLRLGPGSMCSPRSCVGGRAHTLITSPVAAADC